MMATLREQRRLHIAIELAATGSLTVGELATRLGISDNQVHVAIYRTANRPGEPKWFTHNDPDCHPRDRRHFLTELGKKAVADAQSSKAKVA